ncbi:hypothetical protein VDGD_20366 [Verticillium dahliae]|nr:hypothetical protein VDGD_20366 [Verticillium dahliae]
MGSSCSEFSKSIQGSLRDEVLMPYLTENTRVRVWCLELLIFGGDLGKRTTAVLGFGSEVDTERL